MKARKYGRIITFSMANADQMVSQPDVTAHYIAKAGVLILTRTLAKLLAPHGITVNAVSPASSTPAAPCRKSWPAWLSEFPPAISEQSMIRSPRCAIC